MSAGRMEEKMRALEIPIIVRAEKDEVLIGLRTVAEDEFGFIVEGLKQAMPN